MSVGTFFSTNDGFSWRFPLSLQVIWPVFVLILIKNVPESPRWRKDLIRYNYLFILIRSAVVTVERKEEALAILCDLHSGGDSKSHQLATAEFEQITCQIAADQAAYGHISILDLFRKAHFRKRMVVSALVMFTSQAGGNLVVYSNITILYRGLGLDTSLSLIISAVYITWACICNFANASFLDRLGRVRSLRKNTSTRFGNNHNDVLFQSLASPVALSASPSRRQSWPNMARLPIKSHSLLV